MKPLQPQKLTIALLGLLLGLPTRNSPMRTINIRIEAGMIVLLKTTALFALTAIAEIVGCYLPRLVLKQNRSIFLLIPAAVSLLWLWQIDGIPLTRWDVIGAVVALSGMAIIVLQPPTNR